MGGHKFPSKKVGYQIPLDGAPLPAFMPCRSGKARWRTENRENNREFAKFSAILAPSRIKSRSNSRVLPRNSRRKETGNSLVRTGKFITWNREFAATACTANIASPRSSFLIGINLIISAFSYLSSRQSLHVVSRRVVRVR